MRSRRGRPSAGSAGRRWALRRAVRPRSGARRARLQAARGPGRPTPKRNGAKIGAIAAVVVVALVLVAGFATNWFGLAACSPRRRWRFPPRPGRGRRRGANAADGQSADANESAGDAQGGSQDATGAAVKSAVEAYHVGRAFPGSRPRSARPATRRRPSRWRRNTTCARPRASWTAPR